MEFQSVDMMGIELVDMKVLESEAMLVGQMVQSMATKMVELTAAYLDVAMVENLVAVLVAN